MKEIKLASEDVDILQIIKSGDRSYLKDLYQKHRKEFGQWAIKHYQVDDETAGEVYQQTFIAFYYNIIEGKLTQMKSTTKTYLFAIGKNLLREHFKTGKRFTGSTDDDFEFKEADNSIHEKYEQSELQETLQELLKKIGEPCKTVIELFYYHHYSMDSIASHLNYKTEQIAAKRKFICLKQLRTMMEDPQFKMS